jgi:cytochrome c biogenesis protein CcdA
MKPNKAHIAVYGGILVGFLTLGIVFYVVGGAYDDTMLLIVVGGTFISLLAAHIALSGRKRYGRKRLSAH